MSGGDSGDGNGDIPNSSQYTQRIYYEQSL